MNFEIIRKIAAKVEKFGSFSGKGLELRMTNSKFVWLEIYE